MKKKNFNNRLVFNKTSVIELNNKSLHKVVGGSTGAVCNAIGNAIINAIKDKATEIIDNIGQPIIK
jgi:hypothetical protein